MDEIAGGVLAGGRSSRMGQNKAFLPFENSDFLLHSCELLSKFNEVLISADQKGKYQGLPYPIIEDKRKGCGPIEGVYQLLKSMTKNYLMLIAVDMPLLNQDLLLELAEMVPFSYDCVLLSDDRRVHPFCGIYHKRMLSHIRKYREDDGRCMTKLLEAVNAKVISITDMGYHESILSNINTMQDYCSLRKVGV